MESNRSKLTPIRHAELDDHHRVPVFVVDGKYEIYLNQNFVRIYDENELPDLVKSRIAMVKAGTKRQVSEIPNMSMSIYDSSPDTHLSEIGWQPCQGLYVLVLPTKYLTYMEQQAYNQPLTYRNVAGVGFIASDRPTFRTMEEYESWLHLKLKSKEK
jgi:hypothetical protein